MFRAGFLKNKRLFLSLLSLLIFVFGAFGVAEAQFFKSLFWKKRGARNSWSTITAAGAPAAPANSGVWTGSQALYWGSSTVDGLTTARGGLYNPTTNVWTSMAGYAPLNDRNPNPPGFASGRFVSWGGLKVTVIPGTGPPDKNGIPSGGSTTFDYFNTGGIYNPSTDTWIATNLSGAPSGRSSASVVSSSNRVLIWGGSQEGNLYLNTGAVLNPVSNTWSAISTSGAPIGRNGPATVWTGSQMIVWGGATGTQTVAPFSQVYTRTGGIYNLATNSWTTMSTAGAPSARGFSSAVWTGTQMIVWGGVDNATAQPNGGIYTLATNSWSPLSTIGTPVGLVNHGAVWTGSQMIVWGGATTGIITDPPINNGRVYTVSGGTSTATSLTNAPAAQNASTTTVWTGSKMVTWRSDSGGGVYTP